MLFGTPSLLSFQFFVIVFYTCIIIHPQVTKKQVDNFKEGQLTPCCQLLAEVSARKKEVPVLKHQVNLKGAKYPHNVFVISLPAGGKL